MDPAEAAALARLEVADTQTLTPLLLWLFANTNGPVRLQALSALESYVVRRTLCRLTPKNYNRLFLELLRRLGDGAGPAGVIVEEYLAGQGSVSGMWPSDAEFAASIERLPLYRLIKRDRLQRVLLALEAHLTTARTEPVPPSRKLSVEHLLPQAWSENWPLPLDPAEAEAVRQERESVLHTLGNLTLVTGSLNAGMSNAAWSRKRQHLLANSALTLNRSLPDHWDVQEIKARGTMLAATASALWTRPPTPVGGALYVSDAERDLRPERDVESAPGRPANSTGKRRDIALHIAEVFADVPSETFLSVAQIRRVPTSQYPDGSPSAGAISNRLFPPNGGEATVPGVRPATRNGVRGAARI
jgi:uncharacterized protein DUF1524